MQFGINLVINNLFDYLCIKFESNRTITYGDIADLGDTSVVSECILGVNLVISYGDISFWRFGGYECRLAVNGCESSEGIKFQ